MTALLELGAGFHPDLTGAENVRINAALLGLTRRQTAERFDDIVEFSGVREFIDEPLRTYSSGMVLRLAFCGGGERRPRCSADRRGDRRGRSGVLGQGLEKIRGFQRAGKTMLLASHASELMTTLCERALWLDHGRIMMSGTAREVLAAYQEAW